MSPVQMLGRELEIKGVTSYINSEASIQYPESIGYYFTHIYMINCEMIDFWLCVLDFCISEV